MFKKIKSIFSKKKPDNLGGIHYNLLECGDIEVNVFLRKLDDDSLKKFASLFARVTTLNLGQYTIELTKKIFMEHGEEYYVKMILHSAEECNAIIEDNSKILEEYIKPSEMFGEQ
tara:strand:+ start:264 stop:608 length:345 start_codon:yes stop_codon:yes gene_type:complete